MTPQDSPEARIAEIRDELIRRASEGCEGPTEELCVDRTVVRDTWCDPCRCQEGANSIDVLSRRLHEQAQEIERLRAQALAISASLAEFRIGPCSLPQGVIELGQRAEAAESALATAQQEIERLNTEWQRAETELAVEGAHRQNWQDRAEAVLRRSRAVPPVTRFEVIDHRTPYGESGVETGRVYAARDCHVELSYQDGGKTLKVFVTGERAVLPEPPISERLSAFRDSVTKLERAALAPDTDTAPS